MSFRNGVCQFLNIITNFCRHVSATPTACCGVVAYTTLIESNTDVTTWTVETRVCKLCLQSKAVNRWNIPHMYTNRCAVTHSGVLQSLNVNSI